MSVSTRMSQGHSRLAYTDLGPFCSFAEDRSAAPHVQHSVHCKVARLAPFAPHLLFTLGHMHLCAELLCFHVCQHRTLHATFTSAASTRRAQCCESSGCWMPRSLPTLPLSQHCKPLVSFGAFVCVRVCAFVRRKKERLDFPRWFACLFFFLRCWWKDVVGSSQRSE